VFDRQQLMTAVSALARYARCSGRLRPQAIYDHATPTLKALHWLPVKHRIEFKVTSAGSSSHQRTGTCLPAESPHNYCIRVWSCLKPLGQQQWPCQTVNQTQTWWSRFLCSRTLCLKQATQYPLNSKPSLTLEFLDANLNLFYFRQHTLSAH